MYLRMIEDMLDHSMLMLHELEGIFFFLLFKCTNWNTDKSYFRIGLEILNWGKTLLAL